jgi:hypothetical protein
MAAASNTTASIPGINNSVAMRQAILRNLGISPAKLTGFKGDASFDQNIDNLYLKGLQDDAAFDSQSGALNRTYAQNTADAKIKQQRALQALQENAAGRGMLHSSGFVDQTSDANRDYTTYLQNLLQNRNAGLADIQRQRQNSDLAITRGTMDQERSYGQSLQDFLQQQAVASWVAETNAQKQRAAQAQMLAAARPAPPRTTGTTPQYSAPKSPSQSDLSRFYAGVKAKTTPRTPSPNLVLFG